VAVGKIPRTVRDFRHSSVSHCRFPTLAALFSRSWNPALRIGELACRVPLLLDVRERLDERQGLG
jgi:hypothetical protein